MREFKFRAWDTVGKQWLWITGFETAETSRSEGYTLSGLFHDGDYIGDEVFVLMQYTGLKDKNGKEIYEGDIVEETGMEGYHYKVLWNISNATFDFVDLVTEETFHAEDIYFNVSEVVGNIYENPELLERR